MCIRYSLVYIPFNAFNAFNAISLHLVCTRIHCMNRRTQKFIAALLMVLVTLLPMQTLADFCDGVPETISHSADDAETPHEDHCHETVTTQTNTHNCSQQDCHGQHSHCSMSAYLLSKITSKYTHMQSSWAAVNFQILPSIIISPDLRPPIIT